MGHTVFTGRDKKLGFSPTAYDKYTIDHVTDGFRGDLYNRSQYSGSSPI